MSNYLDLYRVKSVDPTQTDIFELNMKLLEEAKERAKDSSSEVIPVLQYDQQGNPTYSRIVGGAIKSMELGARDPLFVALTLGGSSGREGLKQGFNLLDDIATKVGNSKFITKGMSYLNQLTPGTKEFMQMWNAGKAGKVIGAGVTGLNAKLMHDAYKDAAADPSAENIAMATMTSLPFMNGVGNMYSSGMNTLSRISKPFRDFRVAANMWGTQTLDDIARGITKLRQIPQTIRKQWTADERMRQIIRKQKELEQYWSNREREANRHVHDLRNQAQNADIDAARAQGEYESLADPQGLIWNRDGFKIPLFFRGNFNPRSYYNIEAGSGILPDGVVRRARYTGSSRPHGDQTVHFDKLSEEDIWRLLASRIANNRQAIQPKGIASIKKLFQEKGIVVEKSPEGHWRLRGPEMDIGVHDLYAPETFVSTKYSLPSFKNPAEEILTGEIHFGGGTGIPGSYTPMLDLNTGTIPIVPKIGNTSVSSTPNYLQYFDEAYRARLQENIAAVEEALPGFVPFGSAKGVASAGFPHATHDIDGYMSIADFNAWKAQHPELQGKFTSPDTYKIRLFPQAGEAGDIDINILRSDDNGFVIGDRATEIARQFFPKQYSEWVKDPSKPLQVKLDDVMRTVKENATAKSIADVFEIFPQGTKAKQAGRNLVYLSSADPTEVQKGLQLHGRAFGAEHGFPASVEELTDVELNRQIVKSLGIPVSTEEVIQNPQKMKNLLDYWYMQQTVRGRGVSNVSGQALNNAMFGAWDPRLNSGGTANGIGRNTVSFGNSGHGSVYGYWQIHPSNAEAQRAAYTNKKIPIQQRIEDVRRMVGDPTYEFGPEDIKSMQEIAKRHGLNLSEEHLKNSEAILNNLPHSQEGANFLHALQEELGIYALTRSNAYGSGIYSSMTGITPTEGAVFVRPKDTNPMHIEVRKRHLASSNDEAEAAEQGLKELYRDVRDNKVGQNYRSEELDTRVQVPREGFMKRFAEYHLRKNGKWEAYQQALKALQDKVNDAKEVAARIRSKDLPEAEATSLKIHSDGFTRKLQRNLVDWRYGDLNQRKITKRKDKIKAVGVVGSAAAGSSAASLGAYSIFMNSGDKQRIAKLSTEQIQKELSNRIPGTEYSTLYNVMYGDLEEELANRLNKSFKQGGSINIQKKNQDKNNYLNLLYGITQ